MSCSSDLGGWGVETLEFLVRIMGFLGSLLVTGIIPGLSPINVGSYLIANSVRIVLVDTCGIRELANWLLM